ncbi:MAG: OmpA family protein [bacterium]
MFYILIKKVKLLTKLLLFIIFQLFFFKIIFPQEKDLLIDVPYHSYGLYSHYILYYQDVEFRKLPGIPNCCPVFQNGYGFGYRFGLFYNYPLSYQQNISFRLGFQSDDTELNKTEKILILLQGEPITGEFEHVINAKFNSLTIEPLYAIKFLDAISIKAGCRAGLLLSNSYSQYEKIIKPEGKATFLDSLGKDSQSIFRNKSSGEIPDINNIQFSLQAGFSYDLPLNKTKTFYLTPELFLSYGLTPLVKNMVWFSHSVSVGLTLKYVSIPIPEIKEKFEHREKIDTIKIERLDITESIFEQGNPNISIDTIEEKYTVFIIDNYKRTDTLFVPKEYQLSASINATAINEKGKEIQFPTFQVEEFLSTKMHPLLNYVFFEENSATLPERYKVKEKNDTKDFRIDKLFQLTTLEVYYHILDIIGSRLVQYPDAQLSLIGCNSNQGLEARNTTLSNARAETVKNYLQVAWDIPENRIKIKSQNLPDNQSNIKIQEGIEENRRVEIYSDDKRIIAPVVLNDTMKVISLINLSGDTVSKVDLKGINFSVNVIPDLELRSWVISVSQNEEIIKEIKGTGKISKDINWEFETEADALMILSSPTGYDLKIEDYRENKVNSFGMLDVKQKTISMKKEKKEGDKRYDSYSLILFEYGSMNLSKYNRDIPSQISKNIESNSIVKVMGYSDRIGNPDYNITLSRKRAKTVADAIRHKNTSYDGLGATKLLYNNDLPEGRFYCRTIEVIVETPIKW